MNLIKPKRLQKGDTIRIIATSGEVDIEKIRRAKLYFENLGYKVKLSSNLEMSHRELAGDDCQRLEALHEAFLDPQTDVILCARGGYGAIRLIKNIDYELIRNNPKIFCGYSDITALSAMILRKSGLITFSGPMAQGDFGCDDVDKFTEQSFFDTLSGGKIELKPIKKHSYGDGNFEGILFGGNLSTLVSLCGQDFIPDEKFIFVAEDLNEPVYKLDRYFAQLLNIDKFRQNLAGIVLGEFLDVDSETEFDKFFQELADDIKLPIIGTFPISHSKTKAAIPIGAAARIENETLIIEDFTA